MKGYREFDAFGVPRIEQFGREAGRYLDYCASGRCGQFFDEGGADDWDTAAIG